VPAGVSTGSSTPGAAGAAGASTGSATAQAPSANNAPLATPSDASMTAVSAQFLLIGPDAWPFEDDRQAKLLAALQADLGPLAKYTTGKPFKYSITDVRSSSASSAPPGRKLLQARCPAQPRASRLGAGRGPGGAGAARLDTMLCPGLALSIAGLQAARPEAAPDARAQALNALVTAQIDTGSINLVSGVRSNLVSDVQSGALLVRALNLPWRLRCGPAHSLSSAQAPLACPAAPPPVQPAWLRHVRARARRTCARSRACS
jgi:hypothetical protein